MYIYIYIYIYTCIYICIKKNIIINFRLFKNRNDIAALMFTNLSMIKQYYTIKLKVSEYMFLYKLRGIKFR